MLIGYARISKADGSQSLDLQRDALREADVRDDAIYEDQASGQREDRMDVAEARRRMREPTDKVSLEELRSRSFPEDKPRRRETKKSRDGRIE